MNLDELNATVQKLHGECVSHASLCGHSLGMFFGGDAKSLNRTSVSIGVGWELAQNGQRLIRMDQSARYEGDFKTEAEWEAYMAQEADLELLLVPLIGTTLLSIVVGPELNQLHLDLTDGYSVRSLEGAEHWHYKDRHENISLWVDDNRVSNLVRPKGETIATRNFTFERGEEKLPGTLSLSRPLPLSKNRRSEEVYIAMEIETPFGTFRCQIDGSDGIQALQLSLMLAEVEIDKIAKAHGAKVYHLSPNNSVVYKYRDEFTVIHGLLGRIYNKVMHWKTSVGDPAIGENLKLMKDCLDKIEVHRGNKVGDQ